MSYQMQHCDDGSKMAACQRVSSYACKVIAPINNEAAVLCVGSHTAFPKTCGVVRSNFINLANRSISVISRVVVVWQNTTNNAATDTLQR